MTYVYCKNAPPFTVPAFHRALTPHFAFCLTFLLVVMMTFYAVVNSK